MNFTHTLCPKCGGYGRLYYQDDKVAGLYIRSEICPVCSGEGTFQDKYEPSKSDKQLFAISMVKKEVKT